MGGVGDGLAEGGVDGDPLARAAHLHPGVPVERRDAVVNGLKDIGLEVESPLATFYVWFEVPQGLSSKEFSTKLLTEAGIVVTPGTGFGKYGEGYARVSTTFNTERIIQAVERLKEAKF